MPEEVAVLVGIDWADEHHDVSLQLVGGAVERRRLPHTPEALATWMAQLRHRVGPTGAIAIAVETSRGPLVHALLEHPGLVLYPINPRSLKRFRETFTPSGAKADQPDAELLRELLATHRDRLRAWVPDDEATRALRRLVEHRRKTVDLRTQFVQQLTAVLKDYFPQALSWAGDDLASPLARDFLRQWPTLDAVQRARPTTLRRFYTAHNCRRPTLIDQRLTEMETALPLTRDPAVIGPSVALVQMLVGQLEALAPSLEQFETAIAAQFAQHVDADLFSSLPGSGAALAPRLLVAFGSDRTRFQSAVEFQQYSGIAPVTKQSGRSRVVHWRWAASTFVRQSVHEFAGQSIRYSAWARAFYAQQRARGKQHQAAVRALAFKWIRILWRCWRDRQRYDEARYVQALHVRRSPLATRLSLDAA
ncbi:MAG TPA: IS110 family transposase [Gemmatimonadaceae bacterium]|jgi:transposase